MKSPILILMSILFILSCTRETSNRLTYYVSSAGSDSLDGTSIDKAWKTIGRVNREKLVPGMQVLFEGGATFEGTIELNESDTGAPGKPVILSSFGNGMAVINGASTLALKVENCRFFTVKNLKFKGNGRKEGNQADGLYLTGCSHGEIDSVEISGFQHSGLSVFKCNNTRITHVYAHDNGFAGIHVTGTTVWDTNKYDNHNLYIGYCRTENNPGDPTALENHSGSGIIASSVKDGIIEYCESFNNGWDMPWNGNGPVGIWIWDCTDFIIQYCISHDNKTSKGAADGGGFDLDGGVSNSVIQYCLSYHNQGPGIGLFEFGAGKVWENNIIRYNISRDDGTNGQGSLAIWRGEAGGTIRNCEIYNNTFYNSNPDGPNLCIMNNWTGFNFRNNVFVYNGSILFKGKVIKNELFENNCYWNLSGQKAFLGYPDLEKWAKAKGKGLKDGKFTLVYANPSFNDTVTHNITDPAQLAGLTVFHPLASSPLIDAGMDIRSLAGGNDIKNDISGTKVPHGKGFDIGATEFFPVKE